MIFKKLSAFASAMVLVLASLFALTINGQAEAAGTTLYWCEFSSNSDFNTASNWSTNSSCSGGTNEVPVSGDVLVFDSSHLNSTLDIDNDITGLDISSITISGSGNGAYYLSGDAISLDDGITDSGSNSNTNIVAINLTLTANQSITSAGNDNLELTGNVDLGTHNLSVGPRLGSISGALSGSGSLTFEGNSTSGLYYNLSAASSSFSGPVTIDSGAYVQDLSGSLNALGTGTINILSGGSLALESSSASVTYPNPINIAGSGVGYTADSMSGSGAIISCLAYSGNCTSANTDLTLSGLTTLSGNTVVVNADYSGDGIPANNALFNFKDVTYNNYDLSAVTGSNTTIDSPAPVTNNSSSSKTTPKPPDTGYGLTNNDSLTALIGGALMATALVITVAISRKSSKKSNG